MMALKMAMVAVMVAGVMVAVMVAGVMAAPQGTESLSRAKLELPEEPQFPPQPYVFKFNINDEVGGVRFAEIEQMDDNGQVQGTYSYVRPDDVLVVVQYTADEDGFHPQIHEEPAPKFERNPSGTSKFSVSLPYAEEYSVEVTGAQLRQYHDQALQREQQSGQIRQNRESDDQIQEDGPLPQLSQEETTEHQQSDDQIQEDGPLPQLSQDETTEHQQSDDQIQEDGPLPQLSQEETTDHQQSDDQIQEDGPLPQLSQDETTEHQQSDYQIQEDGPLPQLSQEETTEHRE